MANGSSKSLVEYEELQGSISNSNTYANEDIFNSSSSDGEEVISEDEAKNRNIAIQSALSLRHQTHQALKDGFYPIVLGGDQSQAIGSIAGMKSFMPDAKLIWIDADPDAKIPSYLSETNRMPMSFLSGKVPGHRDWAGVDVQKEVCCFGVRQSE
jgi:arginase